ncbi:hypothetical protein KKC83_02445 [Patescibacteria group bacterium]|nr:hypothetical protein [Candidatus Falkowbacteria bacterium]MBU3905924.1 hypothetical protein [Patescibacteria group bacterium]MBU4015051.1 hypothetical protein [Patescibacteria group bacterium]MBU4026376.1 hypothetical protein [Patescibacteria group bacterium]MBU4072641.1 hypothetical protein [Patescibacteria group bacterium]
MIRSIKTVCCAALFIFGALFCQINIASASQEIGAPTIIQVSHYELSKPLITGLTPAGTEILVYINGVYEGLAEVNAENTETDNFYYKHNAALSEGTHRIMLVSRDRMSLVLSSPSQEIKFVVPALPAPTLIEPNINTITGKVKPLVKGLTKSGTFVRVYIDGIYNGKTDVAAHESGTANFAYKPFLNLAAGYHFAQAVSEDSSGGKSEKSEIINFKIEQPMPAPTLFASEVNSKTEHNRPFIVGLAKSSSDLKVFIDHKLDGKFKAENHKSGTASFAYKPFRALASGNHFVYVTATDSRGKESSWSNIVFFNVRPADQAAPALTEEQPKEIEIKAEAEIEAEAEIMDLSEDLEDHEVVVQGQEDAFGAVEENGIAEQEEITDEDIKKIMEEDIVKEEDGKGSINESKQKQGGMSINLIIFIVFLLGIIVWIFWVNKELIKERRAQEKKETIPEDNQAAPQDNSKNNTLFSDRERRH